MHIVVRLGKVLSKEEADTHMQDHGKDLREGEMLRYEVYAGTYVSISIDT